MIFLMTSFNKAATLDEDVWDIWSGAVYQPHWLPHRRKANWMDIRPDFQGTWVRPREYLNREEPLDGYFGALREIYSKRSGQAHGWIDNLPLKDIAVCCWCPYDKAAQRQLKEFGTFVCHTAAIGHFLSDSGFVVEYDTDREKMVRSENYNF